MCKRIIVGVSVVSLLLINMMFASCGSGKNVSSGTVSEEAKEAHSPIIPAFNADSAYQFVKQQVEFGPRIPNTEAHVKTGNWLVAKLKGYGAQVTEQKAKLTAFDGTVLNARNIFAQYNPMAEHRILLLAHWDCRPWADQDRDPGKRRLPVDGANDGASGVGVLLEMARILKEHTLPNNMGVDILFVDAEDWGAEDQEDSWALGTNYFVNNPIVPGYKPTQGIVLDMVGSKNATFYKEYFSELAAPGLNSELWSIASEAGYGNLFIPRVGSAVTDDHRPLIDSGVPTVDIIDYRAGDGFDPTWHTTLDNMENISPETLGAVGEVVCRYIYNSRDK